MTANIVLAILVTSLATYISRFLGALTSEKIGETSKIYKWFNCVAYSTLAALISRMLIFPSGDLGFLKAISKHYKKNLPLNDKFLITLFKRWSPYSSMATWYLWRSLDPIPVSY